MANGSIAPFRPTGTVSLNVGTTSATVQLAGGGSSVIVTNLASALIYVRFGSNPSVSASTGDMPVLPNSKVMLSVNNLIAYAAAVITGGSGSVLFTRGDGSYV